MSPELEADSDQSLSPELLAQIKAIQIRTRRLVTDLMAGEYESAFKGRGMEFEEVREYQPGDDIRHIDWNVTARTGIPFLKEHREERELSVMLLVDVSSSGAFGSSEKLKREIAAEIAAVLAWTAIRSNDRVGLIIFTDHVEHYIPPKKGRGHVWRVIREILSFKPRRQKTQISSALEFLTRVARRKTVTFLLSDFMDQNWEESLRLAAKRHDLTAISISDRREREFPKIGLIELEDAESGERLLVDSSSSRFQLALKQQEIADRRNREKLFRSTGVGQVEVNAHEPYVEALMFYFRRREKGGR